MLKNQKLLTPMQNRANARNQLFRQIHGFSILKFIDTAVREHAVTRIEREWLEHILVALFALKERQFENSKKLGFNPRRRCAYCNNIAHYKAIIIGTEKYLCNKHKEEFERNNKQNNKGESMIVDIHKINPYD